MAGPTTREEDSLSVEPQRFAVVPEWMIDAPVSDAAFRLYSVLLRYGGSSGTRMPSRATLARRLHKRSVDTVDRAMKELEALGAVVVERRRDGGRNLTNRYHVRTSDPGRTDAASRSMALTGGRSGTATPDRTNAATPDRTVAAGVAAPVRHDPDTSTESILTQTVSELHRRCAVLRSSLGLSLRGWSAASVARAVSLAVERGHPPDLVAEALEAVARDAATRSPMRVAEAGPWWDRAQVVEPPASQELVAQWDAILDRLDGQRVRYQRAARAELSAEGVALTRAAVLRRACLLLDVDHDKEQPAS